MPGRVPVDVFYSHQSQRRELVACLCPVTGLYGKECLTYSPGYSEMRVCPFLYGLEVRSEWHEFAARSLKEMSDVMATHEQVSPPRTYKVLCLMADSTTMRPGA